MQITASILVAVSFLVLQTTSYPTNEFTDLISLCISFVGLNEFQPVKRDVAQIVQAALSLKGKRSISTSSLMERPDLEAIIIQGSDLDILMAESDSSKRKRADLAITPTTSGTLGTPSLMTGGTSGTYGIGSHAANTMGMSGSTSAGTTGTTGTGMTGSTGTGLTGTAAGGNLSSLPSSLTNNQTPTKAHPNDPSTPVLTAPSAMAVHN